MYRKTASSLSIYHAINDSNYEDEIEQGTRTGTLLIGLCIERNEL